MNVNQSRLWKNIGLAAGFGVVLASPVALHAMVAPPLPKPVTQPAKTTSFVPTCSAAAQVVDSRPDPAWVGASFSGDNCWSPPLPAVFDGTSASREQIVAAIAAEKSYKAKADAYQRCIANAISTRKAAAERIGKPLDVAFLTIETHRITASEDNKKRPINWLPPRLRSSTYLAANAVPKPGRSLFRPLRSHSAYRAVTT